jgi:hypothetical protein
MQHRHHADREIACDAAANLKESQESALRERRVPPRQLYDRECYEE